MKTEAEFKEVLDALETLMQYVGGWDSKPSHPCGKAAKVLRKHKPGYAQ